MPVYMVYVWKIFLENAIKMVSIIPLNRVSEAKTFRTTATWQVPIELNVNIWCSLLKGHRAFMCDGHRFL